MATTLPGPFRSTGEVVRDSAMGDDNSIFKEVVQRDPDICSNCFRRTHDRFERNFRREVQQVENDEGKMEWSVVDVEVTGVEIEMPNGEIEVLGGMDDEVYRDYDSTMKIPEKGAHRGKRTICACGFRYSPDDDDWKDRPLAKKKFFEHAERLLERLEEAGVGIDEESFYEELDARKSDPDAQFADDRIFAQAVGHASSVDAVSS